MVVRHVGALGDRLGDRLVRLLLRLQHVDVVLVLLLRQAGRELARARVPVPDPLVAEYPPDLLVRAHRLIAQLALHEPHALLLALPDTERFR